MIVKYFRLFGYPIILPYFFQFYMVALRAQCTQNTIKIKKFTTINIYILYIFLQVVIIDEAHNLSDTLSCIHSAELTGAQVNTFIYRSCRKCRFK